MRRSKAFLVLHKWKQLAKSWYPCFSTVNLITMKLIEFLGRCWQWNTSFYVRNKYYSSSDTLWEARYRRVLLLNPKAAKRSPISSGVNGQRPWPLNSPSVNWELSTLPCQSTCRYFARASFSALPPPKSQAEWAAISCLKYCSDPLIPKCNKWQILVLDKSHFSCFH